MSYRRKLVQIMYAKPAMEIKINTYGQSPKMRLASDIEAMVIGRAGAFTVEIRPLNYPSFRSVSSRTAHKPSEAAVQLPPRS